ncbi:hypothetical protein QBC44DRAFT_382752 [Cladorrhinum sp. PSN332]|nr:hypothetical protein QBC44DRAFT_382752 [Cladorrhinum sp. PSN332]
MASSGIRTGHWVDWTKGNAVKGATVTLSTQGGGFLLAFVVLFVLFVGSQVWFIIRFVLHQSSATDEPQDALHFQQQALYRNSSSPLSSVLAFFRLHRTWKPENWKRTLPGVLLAAAFTIAYVALALFSSAIVGWASEHRLLSPKNCGYWYSFVDGAKIRRDARENLAATSYARECYGEGPTDPNSPTCNFFPVPRLGWKASQASCPFPDGSVCLPDTPGIEIQTGVIDSNRDLGINESPSNRVTYTRSLSCHILKTDGFTATWTHSISGEEGIQYNYGATAARQHSYWHNLTASPHLTTFTTALLDSHASYGSSTRWTPIPQLQVNASSSFPGTYLLFVSQNSIIHESQNIDPLFRATLNAPGFPKAGSGPYRYVADSPVVPMACVEQHQVCFARQELCTPPVGRTNLSVAIYRIRKDKSNGLNEIQEATASRIRNAAERSGLAELLVTRLAGGSSWLRANDLLGREEDGQIRLIPSGQFETEITTLFTTGLAKFQRLAMQPVTGRDNKGWDDDYDTDKWNKDIWQYGNQTCNSQRVRGAGAGTGTMNFSSLGMGIVFGAGLVLCLMRVLVQRSKFFARKKGGWERDGVLEVQRALFEACGEGKWEGSAAGRPRTVGGERFRYPVVKKGEKE